MLACTLLSIRFLVHHRNHRNHRSLFGISNANDIFLTDGASSGVKMIINKLVRDEKDGVCITNRLIALLRCFAASLLRSLSYSLYLVVLQMMIPIPQYPLYSATLTLNGGAQIGYYLDEKMGWGLQRKELEHSLREAEKKVC
jgi:alanine transaminase